MVTRRSKRLKEVIKQEISSIIVHNLQDPRIGFVTVTNVELSDDTKTAKVYVSILGTDVSEKTNLYGLKSARKYIQGELARRLKIKFTPLLSFHLDESLKKMAHMNNLMNDLVPEKSEQ